MFQVASHPAAMPHYQPAHHRSDASGSRRRDHGRDRHEPPPAIQLPRTLARPAFTDIARDALSAAAPELAAVPDEFIRHSLRAKAPAMHAGNAALAPSHIPQGLPSSRLPPSLSVPLRAPPAGTPPALPTHVLAVSLASKSGQEAGDAPTQLYPVHAVVLAAHCTKLPRLPPAHRPRSSHVALPVIPLPLPSPPAFAIIHPWLYTANLATALSTLLPGSLPPAFLERLAAACAAPAPSPSSPALELLSATLASRTALHTLAAHLCTATAGNLSDLMKHAAHVKELWQDLVALGICDAGLWAALDVAWEVVLGAMNLAAQ